MIGGLIERNCVKNFRCINFRTLVRVAPGDFNCTVYRKNHVYRMIKIYSASNLPEAHLLLNLLQQAGIAAQLLNAYSQGASGEIPFEQTYPQIWLEDERDKSLAEAIIQNYEATPASIDWKYCKKCGERNPVNFELCWQCGRNFDRED